MNNDLHVLASMKILAVDIILVFSIDSILLLFYSTTLLESDICPTEFIVITINDYYK